MTVVLHRNVDRPPSVNLTPVSVVDVPRYRYVLCEDLGGVEVEPLCEFATIEPGPSTRVRKGAGQKVTRWVPDEAVEPAAAEMLDGGRLHTLRTRRLWLRVFRQEALVWEGIPAGHGLSVDGEGNLTVETTWVEPYWLVNRLINGMAPNPNLFTAGAFGASLTGWTSSGSTGKAAGSADPYRGSHYMILQGALGAYEEASIVMPPAEADGIFHWSIVGEHLSGSGWGSAPQVAIIRHTSVAELGDTPTFHELRTVTLDDGVHDGAGAPFRLATETREYAGRWNRYQVRLFAPATVTGRIYEVEQRRDLNVSARRGWDFGTFMADVFDEIVGYLGDGWQRFVQPVDQPLTSPIKEPKANLADLRSLVETGHAFGDSWVRLGTKRWRYGPRRGVDRDDLALTGQTATEVRVTIDGTTGTSRAAVAAIGDGQNGPNRELGFVDAAADGYPLHSVVEATDGTDPKGLESFGERWLTANAGDSVTVEGSPASGPTPDTLPGEWAHRLEPGDSVRWRVTGGSVDESFRAVVETVELDDLADVVRVTWSEQRL